MSAPTPTDAHRDLVELIRGREDPTQFDLSDERAAERIAESEVRAVATVVSNLTCTHHTDKQRAECPVGLVAQLREERDRLHRDLAKEREKVCGLRAGLIEARPYLETLGAADLVDNVLAAADSEQPKGRTVGATLGGDAGIPKGCFQPLVKLNR